MRTVEITQLQVVGSLGMMSEEASQDSPFTFVHSQYLAQHLEFNKCSVSELNE